MKNDCKYCDASLPGIDGMCLDHSKELAGALRDALEKVHALARTELFIHRADQDSDWFAMDLEARTALANARGE